MNMIKNGVGVKDVIKMQQVHGNNVVRVDSKDIGSTIPTCDGLITNDPNVTLCVRVADCLPISVTDKKGRGVGLIHAGWRGLDNKIIEKTIEKMSLEFRISNRLHHFVGEFQISIGPHICAKHFEVKSDVSSKFNGYPEAILKKNGKEYLDLAKVAELQLLEVGVKKENIEVDVRCTFEEADLYSYRRDKTDKRNMIYLTLSPRG